ncbi:TonB-dependent receptor plug domain-containing protein [Sphingomonas cannabina]|uniref:TonB-dependent receptor plug domain-containing protein n=1 Tax=Sphingomonas cannabina TaxID=2899123 RepID=UPI0029E7F0F9|nr:TonB-dependent receptor [Sphingomonas cannabina]
MIGMFRTSRDRREIARGLSLAALAGALLWAGTAEAQVAPETANPRQDTVPGEQIDPVAGPDEATAADIVVTGTLLRGVAPTGTNVIGVTRDEVVATGAASSNDLLASIPQIGNFGTVPAGLGNYSNPIVRPNIRNLGASGGSTTLVLMNGHRLVGAGILQTSVDPSVIPPDAIDRVEVIPDGGSSIYGSDAIGGVINFILRKRYDGIGVNARYGFADNYKTFDASAIAGKDWGSGSIYVSYAYAWHDNLLGIDRDYATANNVPRGGADNRSTACPLANITIGTTTYALPGRVPGSLNRCDQTDYADLYPREKRHSVFASLMQELSDGITFSTTAYWSRRDTVTRTAQGSASGTITAANPYFSPIGAELAHSVAFAFDDVFGPSHVSPASFTSYGVTPKFDFELGGGWQLRTQANFGRSENVTTEDSFNATAVTAALAGTSTATALNPYNLSATAPAVLAAINDFVNYGDADQELAEGRAVLDGPLFAVPGGDVRLAVGAEYHYENIRSFTGSGPQAAVVGASSFASRDVKSVFGEVLVPLVGADNRSGGFYSLEISGSVRYDHYSDVGGTTNPKIGITYRPFQALTLRGNYGTSFHAPSLADLGNSVDSRVQVIPFSPFRAPNSSPFDILRPTMAIAGGNADLRPETADTWSLGFDLKPAALPGLIASATYYNVRFKDAISVPPFTSPILFTDPNYASFFILNPTLAQATAAAANLRIDGVPSLAALYAVSSPYVLFLAQRANLGAVNTSGIDFNLAYAHDTSFGSVNASFAGTYTLKRRTQAIQGGDFSNDLKNGYGRLQFVATLGGKVGDLIGRAALNHRSGFPLLGVLPQTRVSSFDTVDLFLGYDLGKVMKDTMLTVNVDNVFDEDPPYLNNATGYTNGSTLGRLVSFGIRTKF